MLRKILASIMAVTLLTGAAACGGNKSGEATSAPTPTATQKPADSATEPPAETTTETPAATPEASNDKPAPTIVKFGSHWVPGDDPYYVDEITGESGMSPEEQRVRQAATEKVLAELNVKIQWVSFPNDTREDLLRSVLAGDPICDVALLWGGSQGTILGQNIMQDLEPYSDVFLNDPDTAWMYMDPLFGHHYFLAYELSQVRAWPLVFNINYIEAVDALKENGQTVYPTDLYKQGKWTWSVFKDYLSKIAAYYDGRPSPNRPEVPIKAYQTDYRQTAVSLMHTNGSGIYNANGLDFASPAAIKAIEYLDDLMTNNLVMSVRYGDNDVVPGWTWNASDFGGGETVFTDMTSWLVGSASTALAERGESMGIVPFPRPDDFAADDPRYEQKSHAGNTFCVLKGVSAEQTRIALEAFKLFYCSIYREKAGSDKALDYLGTTAEANALADGYDIFHDKIGKDILEIYSNYSPASPNEYSDLLGVDGRVQESIIGQSIYGFDGSPKYAVNSAQKLGTIEAMLADTESAISSGNVTDNIKPNITNSSSIVIAKGTASVDWSQYFTITDNIDGDIPVSNASYDPKDVDLNAVGVYEGDGGLHVAVKDSAGNERTGNYKVTVYDGANTTPPTVTVKAEIPSVAADSDAGGINWANDYIESAADADGLDVKANVTADLSELDVTTPGEYPVVITVKDFAGNVTEVTVTVKVE